MSRSDEFFKKYNGRGIDADGAYGVQCVDSFIQYCRDYGIPYKNTVTGWADGLFTHRKEYYKKFFNIITDKSELKNGDWVFTKNPSHVAMWYNGKFFGQNQGGHNEPHNSVDFFVEFIGAYREKYNTDGQTTFLVKVNCEVLRVRAKPSLASSIVTRVYNGEVFTILETIEAGYTWGRLKSGIGWIALDYTIRI